MRRLLILFLCALSGVAIAAPMGAGSRGTAVTTTGAKVFALAQVNASNIATLAALSNVDGVALQINWRTVEGADGVFDWTTLNSAISAITGAGKLFSLHLVAFNTNDTPTWITCVKISGDAGPLGAFTNGACKPTDATYIAKYKAAVQAMKADVIAQGALSSLYGVGAVVPTSETDILDCVSGALGNFTYDRTAYLAAWEDMADFYNATFTGVKFMLSAPGDNQICRNVTDTTFYQTLKAYAAALTSNFMMFGADLRSTGSGRASGQFGITAYPPLGFQFTDSYVGGAAGDPLRSVCWALANGATYIEFYAADLTSGNSLVTTATSAVHSPSTGCNL